MEKSNEEMDIEIERKKYKLRIPRRWKCCVGCENWFKKEPMYRKTLSYMGAYEMYHTWNWYCLECYRKQF